MGATHNADGCAARGGTMTVEGEVLSTGGTEEGLKAAN